MKRSASSALRDYTSKPVSNKYSNRKQPSNVEMLKSICSQSFQPEYPARQSHPLASPLLTFNSSTKNNYMEYSRPETKQALARLVSRPETSKGFRPSEKKQSRWQPQNNIGISKNYIKQQQPTQVYENIEQNIKIIVTQSNKRCIQKTKIRSKFETDLDDQFLQLFAN